MTNYPINASYDTLNGLFHEGWAGTAADALAAAQAIAEDCGAEPEILPRSVRLVSIEAGVVYKSRAKAAEVWAAEIAAGYVGLIQVWGGWKAEVATWQVA